MKNTIYPNKFRLRVTQKDIDEGDPKAGDSCAIALALKRKFKDVDVVVGGFDVITISNGVDYIGPERLETFIDYFDNAKKKLKPTSFTLTKNEI